MRNVSVRFCCHRDGDKIVGMGASFLFGTGTRMFFLLKSAFWMSLVISAMPGNLSRDLHETASSAPAGMIKDQCVANPRACMAVAGAVASVAAAAAKPKAKAPPQNTLNARDLAAPWKG